MKSSLCMYKRKLYYKINNLYKKNINTGLTKIYYYYKKLLYIFTVVHYFNSYYIESEIRITLIIIVKIYCP